MHDPEYEIPHSFEDVVIDDTLSVIVWIGNEASTKQGEVRDEASPTYKESRRPRGVHAVEALHPDWPG